MPKHIEDIQSPSSMPEKRSIRNVPIPERRRSIHIVDGVVQKGPGNVERRKKAIIEEEEQADLLPRLKTPVRPTASVERATYSHGPRSKRGVWLGAAIAVLVLLFAVLSLFSGAKLSYTPTTVPLTFAGDTYNAHKTDAGGDLLYSVVKLSGSKGKVVAATGEEQASEKASGSIVVYNEASETPQRLIKNTRFETADGKVYRVANDITIPGKKGTTPGSLEITVTADQPGPAYNIGLSDFTLPGLKGDPRYATVYARSKTPMTGGFVGTRKKVSEADAQTARAELEGTLREELIREAGSQVPEDFILYPGLTTITFAPLPQTEAEGGSVTVNLEGNLQGVIFKKADLIKFLAENKVSPDFINSDIPDLANVNATFADATPDLQNAETISVQMNGTATLVLKTDEAALKNDLRGIKNDDSMLPAVLERYPSIKTANATIRPFWKRTFPDNVEDIEVVALPLN